MAIVTSDFITELNTQVRGDFHREYDAAMGVQMWRELALTVPAGQETVKHYWMAAVPGMQDVTHRDLVLSDLEAFNYSLTDKTYKAALEVHRRAIEDDSLGWVPLRVAQLAEEAASHPGQLLFQQIRDGNTSAVVAYSGSNYFADSHSIGGQTIDNNLTGASNVETAIKNGRAAMVEFPDEEGRPMGLTPNVIVCPAELETDVFVALNANQNSTTSATGPIPAAGTLGTQVNGYRVIVNPYLTDASAIMMFHVSGNKRPWIYQERTMPALESATDPNSEGAIMQDRFVFSVRARYVVGPGEPRYGVRVDLS